MSSAMQSRAVPAERGWSATARRVPWQPFAPAGLGEPRQCVPVPAGHSQCGGRAGLRRQPAVGGGLGSGSADRTLPDGLPHLLLSLFSSPISTFCSCPPPLSWSPFSSLGGGGHSARPPPGPPTPFVGAAVERRSRGGGRPRRSWGWGRAAAARGARGGDSVPAGDGVTAGHGPQSWGSPLGRRERSRSPEGCRTLSII